MSDRDQWLFRAEERCWPEDEPIRWECERCGHINEQGGERCERCNERCKQL